MLVRMLAALAALLAMAVSAEARRVALVIGQNAYPGGTLGPPSGSRRSTIRCAMPAAWRRCSPSTASR